MVELLTDVAWQGEKGEARSDGGRDGRISGGRQKGGGEREGAGVREGEREGTDAERKGIQAEGRGRERERDQ